MVAVRLEFSDQEMRRYFSVPSCQSDIQCGQHFLVILQSVLKVAKPTLAAQPLQK